MSRLFRPLATPATYRALLFYVAELALGVTAFAALITAWAVTVSLAITPLVVPLLIGLGFGVALLARAEAALAQELLGISVRPSPRATGGGFWERGFRVLRDRGFWLQQAHVLISWPIALIPVALAGWGLELLSLPIWYRWVGSEDVFGFWTVDRFVETLPVAALGLVVLVANAHLLGPLTALSRRLANRLLAGNGVDAKRTPAEKRVARLRGLTVLSLVATAVVVVLVVIWGLTGQGYFWPIWPLLSMSLVVGITGWIVLVLEHPLPRRLALGSTALAIQIGASAILWGFLVAVWAITTHGYFWPVWPLLGLALAAAVHAAILYGRRTHRIEELERSRAGAVDVQEAELRRIERDLHDGAQARLVALGMNLGLAEQQLDRDPAAVRALLAEARLGAAEALEELRDLARGIHPPILTDRGLEAAVAALVARSPVPVSLDVQVPDRPPAAVETAAYFTVAEALANAIKHADATRVAISIHTENGALLAEVTDDGRGGVDPSGSGFSGLRQRLEALDGTLRISSPEGGPTIVRAELPCES